MRRLGSRIAEFRCAPAELRERIVNAFREEGKTQAEIAAQEKCSQASVSRILAAEGVSVRRRGWVRRKVLKRP